MVRLKCQDNYILSFADMDENNKPIYNDNNELTFTEYKRFQTYPDLLNDSKLKQVYPDITLVNIKNICSQKQIGKYKWNLIKITKLFNHNIPKKRVSTNQTYHYKKNNFKLHIRKIVINDNDSITISWTPDKEYTVLQHLVDDVKIKYPEYYDLTCHKIELMKKDKLTNTRTQPKYGNIKIERLK